MWRYRGDMTTVQVVFYRNLSVVHLRVARALLAEGDPMEALERGWAAVASELQLAANARGLPHDRHRELWAVVRALIQESGDSDIGLLFGGVQAMQINFYDVPYDCGDIEWYLGQVERLLGKLDGLA